jgi:Plasma-membrane choline transporter
LDAARDTWRLIKDRGFDAIINDLLIDNVLTMGSILISYITAFLCYLYLKYTDPAYNSSGGFNAPIIAFGFLIGLQMVPACSPHLPPLTVSFPRFCGW